MIIRLMGEGQYVLDEATGRELNHLDGELEAAFVAGDGQKFAAVLQTMHAYVKGHGERLHNDELRESDAILPPIDATMTEVQELMTNAGLIPG